MNGEDPLTLMERLLGLGEKHGVTPVLFLFFLYQLLIGGTHVYDKWLNLLIAYCGTLATYFYGGWNEALSLLAILAVLDFISGLGASISEGIKHPDNTSKVLSSKKGFRGITKKAAMFIIAVLFRIDSLLGLNGILSLSVGATYFYLSESIS